MKKKHLICMVIYFLVVGVIIFGTDNLEIIRTALEYVKCGNSKGIPKPIPMLTSWVFTILLVATPIVLIVFSIITLAKSTVAGNPDEMTKARNKLFKKLIGCALAFLVVALSRYVLLTAATGNDSDKDTITSCISCYLFNSCQNDRDTNKDINKTVEKKNSNLPTGMQSSVNNSSNNNSNSVSNVSSNTTTPAVSTKVLFIGDSRTVGMCGYTGSELYNVQTCKQHKFIGKVGIGYSYFSSNIINNIKSAVANTNDKYKIVILLGVNDLGNGVNISTISSNYMNIITRLANNELKNHSITFVSVPPVSASNSYNIPVTNINNFNNNMKQKINSLNLNNVKYCDISTSFNASNIYQPDGLHYTSTGYTYLYNQVVNKCI